MQGGSFPPFLRRTRCRYCPWSCNTRQVRKRSEFGNLFGCSWLEGQQWQHFVACFTPIDPSVSESIQLEHTRPRMSLGYPDQGPAYVTNVNYPLRSPSNLVLLNVVTCPPAHNIRVALPLDEAELEQQCGGTYLEIEDPYKLPRKKWRFCQFSAAAAAGAEAFTFIQAYLNILKFRQVTGKSGEGLLFKLTLHCVRDEDTALKVMQIERTANGTGQMAFDSPRLTAAPASAQQSACDDNLCFNGGRCVDPSGGGGCACVGHFAGRHCLETVCDARPCRNGGQCSLTATGFTCECSKGFRGSTCRERAWPCSSWPCGRHGICEEANDAEGFRCKCHLWWTGKQRGAASRRWTCGICSANNMGRLELDLVESLLSLNTCPSAPFSHILSGRPSDTAW